MNKKIVGIGVVIFLGLGVIFYTAPMRAMNDIKQGFIKKNSILITSHVDFPLLREDIKEQLLSQQSIKNQDKSNAFKVGHAIGASMMDNMLQSYFTPSGLKRLLRKDEKSFLGKDMSYDGSFINIDTYSVNIDNGDDKNLNMIMKRTGVFLMIKKHRETIKQLAI